MTTPIDTYKVKTDAILDERDDGDVIFMLCDEIDRLRAGKPHGKMVRVKVAVIVDNESCWSASGWTQATNEAAVDDANEYFEHDKAPRHVYWLTAYLPVPEETTVEAEVENVSCN